MQNINTLQQLFNQYLLDNHIDKEPKALYDPFNYIMNIGGKRMRPVMALLACYLFEEEVEKALPVALSVEVFHNFSLVHDDIMDEAPLRRGQATVHSKYGLNSGILSGDVMLIFAYDYLRHSPRQQAIAQLYQTLSEVAIQVCEGQQYDIDFEQRDDVRLEQPFLGPYLIDDYRFKGCCFVHFRILDEVAVSLACQCQVGYTSFQP